MDTERQLSRCYGVQQDEDRAASVGDVGGEVVQLETLPGERVAGEETGEHRGSSIERLSGIGGIWIGPRTSTAGRRRARCFCFCGVSDRLGCTSKPVQTNCLKRDAEYVSE